MSKNEVSINLSPEELDLLKALLESEYFQVSGVVEVSKANGLKKELGLLKELLSRLEKPTYAAA